MNSIFYVIHSKSELISIAGIHATLLTILVACLSVYTIVISEKILAMQEKAKLEAEKINEIRFNRYSNGAIHNSEAFDREKLVKDLSTILFHFNDPSLKGVEREERALGIMNALMNQYPFCNRFFKTEEGNFGTRGEAEPILFEDFNGVTKWVHDVDIITGALISFWEEWQDIVISIFNEYKEKEFVKFNIQHCLEKGNEFHQNERVFGKDLFTERFCDPVESCKDFFYKLNKSRQVMEKSAYYIMQVNSYKQKIIPYKTMVVSLLMIFLVFIIGVVFPLHFSSVNTVWLLWIPFLLYGTGYFILAMRLLNFMRG